MAVLITVKLKNGTVLTGLSYRTDASAQFNLATPQAGVPVGPTYSIQGPNGWITIPVADIAEINYQPGKPT